MNRTILSIVLFATMLPGFAVSGTNNTLPFKKEILKSLRNPEQLNSWLIACKFRLATESEAIACWIAETAKRLNSTLETRRYILEDRSRNKVLLVCSADKTPNAPKCVQAKKASMLIKEWVADLHSAKAKFKR